MNSTLTLTIVLLAGQVTADVPEAVLAPPIRIEQTAPRNAPTLATPPREDPVSDDTALPVEQSSTTDQPGSPDKGTTVEQPLVPVDPAETAATAESLLQEALAEPSQGALTGQRTLLAEAIEGTVDRRQQFQIVTAYWRLSIRLARYHHALDAFERLAEIPPPSRRTDQVALEATRARAHARLREAELAAVAAQYDLAEASPRPFSDAPPLPADPPFVGSYRTNFQSMFADRAAPAGLRRIDQTLPLRLALVDARASATATAADSVRTHNDAYRAGQIDLASLLKTHAELRDQREAFLTAVRDYNGDIASYALAVAGADVDRETLVSMLIETTPQTRSVLVPKRDVVPASAAAPVDVAPKTDPPDSDPAPAEPAPFTPPPERSILKSIRKLP